MVICISGGKDVPVHRLCYTIQYLLEGQVRTMVCERCGSEIEDSASICSSCGSSTTRARGTSHQHTNYGHYPQNGFGEDFSSQRRYRPQAFVPPSRDYLPPVRPEHTRYQQGAPDYQAAHNYQARTTHTSANGGAIFTNKNNSALLAEII